MNLEALFKISHGVYLTGAKDSTGRLVGSCVDAVMVAEVAPAQILISMGKTSYTCATVRETKQLTLSVLPTDAPTELIQRFGMQSSRTADKWQDTPHRLSDGLPVLSDAVASLRLTVAATMETATHTVFLCTATQIDAGTMTEPLIYADYQNRKEKKMTDTKKWVCTVCGYVYDGEVPFEELPDTWVCPLCGEPKSVFVQE